MEDAELESTYAHVEERNALELAVPEERIFVAAGVNHERFGATDALWMKQDEDGCGKGPETEFVGVHHGGGATRAAPAVAHSCLSGRDENIGSALGCGNQFPCLNGAIRLAQILRAELAYDAIVEAALCAEDGEDALESEIVGCAEALPAWEGKPCFSTLGQIETGEKFIALSGFEFGKKRAQQGDLAGDGFDSVLPKIHLVARNLFGGELLDHEGAGANELADLVAHLSGKKRFIFEQSQNAASIKLLNDLRHGVGERVLERDAEALVLFFGWLTRDGNWHPAISKRLFPGHVFLFLRERAGPSLSFYAVDGDVYNE